MRIRALLCSIAGLWLLVSPAQADIATSLNSAAADYINGKVLAAERTLEAALEEPGSAGDHWAVANLLIDVCTYAYDYACLDRNWKKISDAAEALNAPQITAGKIVFVLLFNAWIHNDTDSIRDTLGSLDFAINYANPLADPVLATRLYLLNAAVQQDVGEFGAARRYMDRAFASLLRIDGKQDSFQIASLMKTFIELAGNNHDAARAARWVMAADPVIRRFLPQKGFDFAEYLLVRADVFEAGGLSDEGLLSSLDAARNAFADLDINPDQRISFLSAITLRRAAVYSLAGNAEGARAEMAADPYKDHRDEILRRGNFASLGEFSYATAEIFFDALAGQAPDARWLPLFIDEPDWRLGSDLASQVKVYRQVALALLSLNTDRNSSLTRLKSASRERLDAFERGRKDAQAFPLPTLLDKIVLEINIALIPARPDGPDSDLLLRSMELLDRNPRYVISDTMAKLAAQKNQEQRRGVHALLRLSEKQQDWESDQLRGSVSRLATGQPPPQEFTAQLTAQAFGEGLTRLNNDIEAASVQLPTLDEVQNTLGSNEALLGYVAGARVCVRKNGIWMSHLTFDATQVSLDVKLLAAALSLQNAPLGAQDSQFPVAASQRLYNFLFDGLAPCLAGIRHLVLFPPPALAGIPAAILLRDPPPRLGDGYDLGQAHWLIRDYAVSTVTSIRDFLSSRSLSRQLSAAQGFVGIGDPQLATSTPENVDEKNSAILQALKAMPDLPETRNEVEEVAKLFAGRSDLRLGANASEERFRALPLDQYMVLHFATHGLVRNDIPGLDEAALIFTPQDMQDSFNDGILTTSEIANLSLSAKLVVLSACNTANFDPTQFTSQLQGLASAFAAAGAPTTIAALWPVNSAIGEQMMVRFYEKLLSPDHPTVAEALRQAMLEIIRDAPAGAYRNPRFWAPFIVLGDGGAIVSPAAVPARRDSRVAVNPGGGEILAMASADGTLHSSEIGPAQEGKFSAVVAARNGDTVLWLQNDRDLGAGPIALLKGTTYAAGYISNVKPVPVVRAFSADGKLLWRKNFESRFDGATITAVQADASGLMLIVAPLNANDGKIDFDILHVNLNGEEISRREISTDIPGMLSGLIRYSIAKFDGRVYVSAAHPPTKINPIQNDFGYLTACAVGRGTHTIELSPDDLAITRQTEAADINISGLKATADRLLFSGSQQNGCGWSSEKPVFGRLDGTLKPQILWADSGVFYGSLISIAPVPGGYIGVANVEEPLDVAQSIAPPAIPTTKHVAALDLKFSEAVVIRFNADGTLAEKIFLGNGLPQFAQGVVSVSPNIYAVYGSDGFNPWIEFLQ